MKRKKDDNLSNNNGWNEKLQSSEKLGHDSDEININEASSMEIDSFEERNTGETSNDFEIVSPALASIRSKETLVATNYYSTQNGCHKIELLLHS